MLSSTPLYPKHVSFSSRSWVLNPGWEGDVSKTALLGLTRTLALELAPKNIRVNCLVPGIIKADFSQVVRTGCLQPDCMCSMSPELSWSSLHRCCKRQPQLLGQVATSGSHHILVFTGLTQFSLLFALVHSKQAVWNHLKENYQLQRQVGLQFWWSEHGEGQLRIFYFSMDWPFLLLKSGFTQLSLPHPPTLPPWHLWPVSTGHQSQNANPLSIQDWAT